MENTKCPVAKKCSGCQLSNLSYEQQLAWKQKDVAGLLGSYGEVSPIIPMEPPCGYRCKVQAVFRSDRSGRIISGVYQSSRNGIVGIDRCVVDDPRADEIIVGIRELMRSFKIRPWDPGTDRGFIKHVLVRIGRNTGEILVTIVGGTSMFPKKRDFVTALRRRGIHCSEVEANAWIAREQSYFVDKTPDHSENRLWMMANMGRVI